MKVAVVSASRNLEAILVSAGLENVFDVHISPAEMGRDARGKQDAVGFHMDASRKASEVLGVTPANTVVIDDSVCGVAAGYRGGFGQVIGVDRSVHGEMLRTAGAHYGLIAFEGVGRA